MITFSTSNPAGLLAKFDSAIAKGHASGGVATWQKIGSSYTHLAPQWAKLAYFAPEVRPDALVFNIIKNKGSNVSIPVYGYYHGHLLETFLNHFDQDFFESSASPLCVTGQDFCSA
jgi:hypothetical protein